MFVRAFEPDEDYDPRTSPATVSSRYGVYLNRSIARRFACDGGPTVDAGEFVAFGMGDCAAADHGAALCAHPPGVVQDTSMRWDDDRHLAVCRRVGCLVATRGGGTGVFHVRRWTRDEHGHWLSPDDYAHPNAVAVLRVAACRWLVFRCRRRGTGTARPDTTTAKRAVLAICANAQRCPGRRVFAFDPPHNGRTMSGAVAATARTLGASGGMPGSVG